jgi:hypothetical protein
VAAEAVRVVQPAGTPRPRRPRIRSTGCEHGMPSTAVAEHRLDDAGRGAYAAKARHVKPASQQTASARVPRSRPMRISRRGARAVVAVLASTVALAAFVAPVAATTPKHVTIVSHVTFNSPDPNYGDFEATGQAADRPSSTPTSSSLITSTRMGLSDSSSARNSRATMGAGPSPAHSRSRPISTRGSSRSSGASGAKRAVTGLSWAAAVAPPWGCSTGSATRSPTPTHTTGFWSAEPGRSWPSRASAARLRFALGTPHAGPARTRSPRPSPSGSVTGGPIPIERPPRCRRRDNSPWGDRVADRVARHVRMGEQPWQSIATG